MSFIIATVVAILLALGGSLIAQHLFQKEELVRPIRMIAVALPFMTMMMVLLYSLRASRKMQFEVYIKSISEPGLLLVGGIVAAFVFRRIEGLILAQIFAYVATFLVALYFFCKVYPRSSATTNGVKWKELISYTLPMGWMDVLNIFKQKVDVMIVGRFLPLDQVGIFGVIIEVGNLIKKVRQIFEPIFMPIVTYLHEKAHSERLQKHFALAVRWIMTLALALLIPMYFAPEQFLRVFSPEFVSGGTALTILATGMFFYVTMGLSENVLSMTGHPYINLANALILVTMNMVLHFTLIPRFGLEGAAAATAISFAFISLLRTVISYKILNLHPFGRSQWKPVVAGSVGFIFSFVLLKILPKNVFLVLLVVVPTFFLVYGLLLRSFGFEEEDKDIMSRLKGKFRSLSSKLGKGNGTPV